MPYMSKFWYKTSIQAMVLVTVASILVVDFLGTYAHCFSLGD